MPRERLRPGEWGKITSSARGKSRVAKARIRDRDGKLRLVEACGASDDEARRRLQRKLVDRVPPSTSVVGQSITSRSLVADLAQFWFTEKLPDLSPSSMSNYQSTWRDVGAPAIGDLRVTEVTTGTIDSLLKSISHIPSRARVVRVILAGMFGAAVRLDVIGNNPVRETIRPKTIRKAVRSVTVEELALIRKNVDAYCNRQGKAGPKPGADLQDQIDLLIATGVRISELLALTWDDIHLDDVAPNLVVCATLVVPRGKGQRLHRQSHRKSNAPAVTVILPPFAVDILRHRKEAPVVNNPNDALVVTATGNWVAPTNVRRSWRAALGESFDWVTPHSFRRTVATLVKERYGVEAAQAQLGHSSTAITEAHYIERQTIAPDITAALNTFAPNEGKLLDKC